MKETNIHKYIQFKICYPVAIRQLVKNRRNTRRIRHNSHDPADKNVFNRLSHKLNRMIKNIKQNIMEDYLENLSAEADKDYSLWKATYRLRRPADERFPPLNNESENWMKKEDEKAELFARHLLGIFIAA